MKGETTKLLDDTKQKYSTSLETIERVNPISNRSSANENTPPNGILPNGIFPNGIPPNGIPPNGWSAENIQTLKVWKETLSKSSYMYKYTLERTQKTLNNLLYVILVFGGIGTLFSAITTTIQTVDDDIYRYFSIGTSAIIFLLNATVFIINGKIKIYGYDIEVAKFSKHVESVDNIYADVSEQSILPYHLRDDAFEYIKKTNAILLQLTKNSPELSTSDYAVAERAYNNFLKSEQISMKLVNNTIDII